MPAADNGTDMRDGRAVYYAVLMEVWPKETGDLETRNRALMTMIWSDVNFKLGFAFLFQLELEVVTFAYYYSTMYSGYTRILAGCQCLVVKRSLGNRLLLG